MFLFLRKSPYAKDLEEVTSTENEHVMLRYERALDSGEDDREYGEEEEDEEDDEEDDDLELSDDWDTE